MPSPSKRLASPAWSHTATIATSASLLPEPSRIAKMTAPCLPDFEATTSSWRCAHWFNACLRLSHIHSPKQTAPKAIKIHQSNQTTPKHSPKQDSQSNHPKAITPMQHCYMHVGTHVRTTYTCHDSTGSDFAGCPCVRTLCWLSNWPSASAMDPAGHHYGMPRDILMIGDMCWSATSLQNDQKCF